MISQICKNTQDIEELMKCLDDATKNIYRINDDSPNGWNVEAWLDDNNQAVAHPVGLTTPDLVDDFIDSVWNGPIDSDGIPTHVNGVAQFNTVVSSSNFVDSAANVPLGSGLDQYRISTYINTIGLGTIDLRDSNNNSGEAARIYLSECCGPFEVAGHVLDARPFNAGVFKTQLEEGIHCILVLESDRTAFGGFNLSYAPTGTENFANIPIDRMSTVKPFVECESIPFCDPVPEGWTTKEPKLCTPEVTPALTEEQLKVFFIKCLEEYELNCDDIKDDEGGLPETNGDIVSDNFQDGENNAPFNLQVRNTTNEVVNYEAVVTAEYSTIPNLNAGAAEYEAVQDGQLTKHIFKGQLQPFQNDTFTGGVPNPADTGELTLFSERVSAER